jgi:hypothetical protein
MRHDSNQLRNKLHTTFIEVHKGKKGRNKIDGEVETDGQVVKGK